MANGVSGDGPDIQDALETAKAKVLEAAVLSAQAHFIAVEQDKQRVKVLLERKRATASKIYPNAEFLPGDNIPAIPVYENGRKGVVLGECNATSYSLRWWWRVEFDDDPGVIILQWPPTLTTTAPYKPKE